MPQPPVRVSSQRRRGPIALPPHLGGSSRTSHVITWGEAVDRFIGEARRKNLSVSTVDNYRGYLLGVRTRTFLTDQSIVSPVEFGAQELKDLEREWLGAGVSAATVDTAHRIIKNFAKFCEAEGYGSGSDLLAVKGPRLEQREPETFTDREISTLKAHLAKRPRDLMIVELMLATGLRLAEVCTLTVDDIIDDPRGATLKVRQGKGRKDRTVPLDTPANKVSASLRRYIQKVRPFGTGRRALFLSERRDRGEYQPLTPHAIQTLLRRISDETGIHVNPHKFRHTFATRALAAGVDVMALQKALGHSTLAMVSRYVHYQSEDLVQAWNRRRD